MPVLISSRACPAVAWPKVPRPVASSQIKAAERERREHRRLGGQARHRLDLAAHRFLTRP